MVSNGRSLIVAVKGVILKEGKILLVQRADDDYIGAGTWECAGGKIEFGEGLEAALVREIKEETGLTVSVGNILYAATFMTDSTRQVVILTYLCRTNETTVQLSKEHLDYRWCTKDQIKTLLLPQIISDFEKNKVFELEELL
ncbi:NUDIX hydrolase [Paenibacillus wynnii]|uniref:DNA mismatch repair protein MutT n=1 Tax=Paenibacillus wynnii TaxID=268407 RepID=A0A098M280_9BACL|nr:NUDIX domain-containing protein [Paenibacillus wynnii]KGE16294.1 DNA mismatch repair protein MutT [Paenibacillus wynnii]